MPRTNSRSERPEDFLYIYVKICIETAQAIGFGPQVDLPNFQNLVLEAVKRVRILLRRPIQSSHEGELILVKREFVRIIARSRSERIGKAYVRTPEGYQQAMRSRIVTDIGKIGATLEERRALLDPALWGLRQFVEAEPYLGADVALACIVSRLELQEEAFVGVAVTICSLCLVLGTTEKPPK